MHFLWLAKQVWSAINYFWPVSLGVGALMLVSLLFTWRNLRANSPGTLFLIATPLLVPFIILSWATIMRRSDAHTDAPAWPSYVLAGMLFAAVGLFIFVIKRAVGLRWFATALVLCSAWLSLCTAFVASMALANNWL